MARALHPIFIHALLIHMRAERLEIGVGPES